MNTDNERRRFTRIPFDTAATVVQNESAYHTHILDISLNGVLLETPKDYLLRADAIAYISIFLSESIEIQMQAKLIHSSNQYLGFRCECIDMESVSHLRRLVELNMDDPRAPERVLEELASPH